MSNAAGPIHVFCNESSSCPAIAVSTQFYPSTSRVRALAAKGHGTANALLTKNDSLNPFGEHSLVPNPFSPSEIYGKEHLILTHSFLLKNEF